MKWYNQVGRGRSLGRRRNDCKLIHIIVIFRSFSLCLPMSLRFFEEYSSSAPHKFMTVGKPGQSKEFVFDLHILDELVPFGAYLLVGRSWSNTTFLVEWYFLTKTSSLYTCTVMFLHAVGKGWACGEKLIGLYSLSLSLCSYTSLLFNSCFVCYSL